MKDGLKINYTGIIIGIPALLSGLMVFLISALARELGGSGYSRILAAGLYK